MDSIRILPKSLSSEQSTRICFITDEDLTVQEDVHKELCGQPKLSLHSGQQSRPRVGGHLKQVTRIDAHAPAVSPKLPSKRPFSVSNSATRFLKRSRCAVTIPSMDPSSVVASPLDPDASGRDVDSRRSILGGPSFQLSLPPADWACRDSS